MRYIKRNYLDELISVIGTPDIKVITGVRRSGKSVLLDELLEYITNNIKDSNVIFISFASVDFDDLKDYKSLHEYVEGKYINGKKNVLMIDEVQLCEQFELAINSFHSSGKYDIYLTGSNAFLMSSDLATLFTGRAYPIEVFPFSFKEYLDFYPEKTDKYLAFDDYLLDGGMAGSYVYDDRKQRYKYIKGVYDTIVARDIVKKHNIQNIPLFTRVSDYLSSNISCLTTARSITNTLTSNKQPINNKTVGSYIKYLCDAFVFYPVKRYDVKGKSYLYSQEKYYFSDHAFKFAVLGTKDMDYGKIYENIVAVELIRRGYEIYVGVMHDKEIDFVAQRDGEKVYIQVAYDIGKSGTLDRELSSLLDVRDAYPKILITRTRQPEYNHEGVKIIDIADWLLEK